jgi:disulfide bond formation protein DsbB
MLGAILYIVGIVLAVLAVLDILRKPISPVGKLITCVLVLITSWVGLLVYYLYAKDHLTEWFK